jgi:hypothetical protein
MKTLELMREAYVQAEAEEDRLLELADSAVTTEEYRHWHAKYLGQSMYTDWIKGEIEEREALLSTQEA